MDFHMGENTTRGSLVLPINDDPPSHYFAKEIWYQQHNFIEDADIHLIVGVFVSSIGWPITRRPRWADIS